MERYTNIWGRVAAIGVLGVFAVASFLGLVLGIVATVQDIALALAVKERGATV